MSTHENPTRYRSWLTDLLLLLILMLGVMLWFFPEEMRQFKDEWLGRKSNDGRHAMLPRTFGGEQGSLDPLVSDDRPHTITHADSAVWLELDSLAAWSGPGLREASHEQPREGFFQDDSAMVTAQDSEWLDMDFGTPAEGSKRRESLAPVRNPISEFCQIRFDQNSSDHKQYADTSHQGDVQVVDRLTLMGKNGRTPWSLNQWLTELFASKETTSFTCEQSRCVRKGDMETCREVDTLFITAFVATMPDAPSGKLQQAVRVQDEAFSVAVFACEVPNDPGSYAKLSCISKPEGGTAEFNVPRKYAGKPLVFFLIRTVPNGQVEVRTGGK